MQRSPVVLLVRSRDRQPLRIELVEPLEMGRDADGLILADPLVSRRHARFDPVGDGTVLVSDLESSNGTFVDGQRIEIPTPARTGSLITLGDTEVSIVLSTAPSLFTDTTRTHDQDRSLLTTTVAADTSIDQVAASVTGDLAPQLIGGGQESGTLTILFTDIEASTTRATTLGDAAWLSLLRRHNRLLTTHVAAHRGRIVKSQGDGFMVSFRSARNALLCAIGIQHDIVRWSVARPDEEIRVRIGLHTGEVLIDDGGDLFGRHVIQAARVAALAGGGEIVVSSLVKQIAEPRGDIAFSEPEHVELKGLAGIHTVHRVLWQPNPAGAGVTPEGAASSEGHG